MIILTFLSWKTCKFELSYTKERVNNAHVIYSTVESWSGHQPAHPPPNISLRVSHRIYANLRIESGDGWGGSCPHLPPSRGDANGLNDGTKSSVRWRKPRFSWLQRTTPLKLNIYGSTAAKCSLSGPSEIATTCSGSESEIAVYTDRMDGCCRLVGPMWPLMRRDRRWFARRIALTRQYITPRATAR